VKIGIPAGCKEACPRPDAFAERLLSYPNRLVDSLRNRAPNPTGPCSCQEPRIGVIGNHGRALAVKTHGCNQATLVLRCNDKGDLGEDLMRTGMKVPLAPRQLAESRTSETDPVVPGERKPPVKTMDDGSRGAERRKWLILGAMVFGLFMPVLDNLVVNIATPTIQRSLGAGVSELQWILDAYVLTFASLTLIGGTLGDLYGRKRFFVVGLLLFVLGSLACGLSGSTAELIAFRAIQGVGAAILLPGTLSIITTTFTGRDRGAAIGIWAATSAIALAVGPLIGGWLVEHISWQSIFFINVPVGVVAVAMALLVVPESRDERRSRRLDVSGLVTGTAGLALLVYALIEGGSRGWTDPIILGSFALAATLLTTFLAIEKRSAHPMLDLSLFGIPTVAASSIVAASLFFAMFGVNFFLSLYLQNVRGYSPVAAGVRLFPFVVMIVLVAPMSGRLSDRFGSRWFMTFGTMMVAAGLALLLRTEAGSSYIGIILPGFLVLGAGMALTMSPMTSAVMGSVPLKQAGTASAVLNTSRQFGGVFGIALLGAIITSAFGRTVEASLARHGLFRVAADLGSHVNGSEAASGRITVQGVMSHLPPSTPRSVGQSVVTAVHDSFVHALHIGMLVAIAFALVASLVSFRYVRMHVEDREDEGAVAAAVG
jgi:EmrB/QacA subfamily drug resistance transporter